MYQRWYYIKISNLNFLDSVKLYKKRFDSFNDQTFSGWLLAQKGRNLIMLNIQVSLLHHFVSV